MSSLMLRAMLLTLFLDDLVVGLPPIHLEPQNELIRVLCPLECPTPSLSPVCGTNGMTFSSECEMIKFACESKQIVMLDYNGPCISCPDHCSLLLNPVCATDGNSYANECLMRSVSCETGFRMAVANSGFCVANTNKDVCEELECHNLDNPVCGSDGHTYRNQCYLKRSSCQSPNEITVIQDGPCNDDGTNNLLYTSSESQECDLNCKLSYEPVCADDGHLYSNECFMNVQACVAKKPLSVANEGPCPSKEEVEERDCNLNCDLSFKPICANDGQTYSNECTMEVEACKNDSHLEVLHEGSCEAIHDGDQTKCQTQCPNDEAPVCGSDGITYVNKCFLTAYACLQGLKIESQHEGECI